MNKCMVVAGGDTYHCWQGGNFHLNSEFWNLCKSCQHSLRQNIWWLKVTQLYETLIPSITRLPFDQGRNDTWYDGTHPLGCIDPKCTTSTFCSISISMTRGIFILSDIFFLKIFMNTFHEKVNISNAVSNILFFSNARAPNILCTRWILHSYRAIVTPANICK